jgi:adenylyl-sulfate kinase
VSASDPSSPSGASGVTPLAPPERAALHGHAGITVWLTGLPSAGKSTIAALVDRRLAAMGRHAMVLDGDVVRRGLCADLGFSPEDRTENVRRIGEVARLFADTGVVVLVAVIAPYEIDRARVRERLGDRVAFVWVDAPLAVCEARDVKGMYALARAGKLPGFTGVDAPYEPPGDADLVLRSHELDASACADRVLELLRSRGAC